MAKLEGKVALVSGGARGIGAATARRLWREGASVVVGDLLEDEGAALAEELGERARAVRLDVTDATSWAGAVGHAEAGFGGLDVLVNNAGILRLAPLATVSAEEYLEVVRVNELGVVLGMQAVLPAMQRRGGGSIVNISSVAGLTGAVGHLAYGASKWAVRGMTKTAALELAPLRIRVNSVHPGLVDTPMLDAYRAVGLDPAALAGGVAAGRLASPEDVAAVVAFLASDDSAYATGSEFVVDGGMVAGVPVPRGQAAGQASSR